jgi:hypothetical protein
MTAEEVQKLALRVSNLELALHAMWAMLRELQPPCTQDAVTEMLAEHFDCISDLGGGEIGVGFQRTGPKP